jgi:hypothetical protein
MKRSFLLIVATTMATAMALSACSPSHGDSSKPVPETLVSWVSDQDLSAIEIPRESFYRLDENNFYVADVEDSLSLRPTAALTKKSFLMMKGQMISAQDPIAKKLFINGRAMVCEVSKSTTVRLKPQLFQLVQTEVNDGEEFHLIDLQWTGRTGTSILTRCLSRQPIKLGDLRQTLKNLFVVSLNNQSQN